MSRPVPIVISGISGCGKTTLANGLVSLTGAQTVSRDDIQTEQDGWHQENGKQKAWETLKERAKAFLDRGENVIAEGMPFSRQSERRALRDIAQQAQAQLVWIHISCDVETAQKHIKGQIHPAPDRDNNNIAKVAQNFEPFDDDVFPDITLPAAAGQRLVLIHAKKHLKPFLNNAQPEVSFTV